MLSFGLCLLGGCAATSADGRPDTVLFFPSHAVRTEPVSSSVGAYPPLPLTPDSMSPEAHNGLFIAENLVKTGTRNSSATWGIQGTSETSPLTTNNATYHNTLILCLCGKLLSTVSAHAANICLTAAELDWINIANCPSLYTSGSKLVSPIFHMSLVEGRFSVTDSFSGQELTTDACIPRPLAFSLTPARVYIWGTHAHITYDFVVSAYRNPLLGVKQLTLPLRALPPAFGGLKAVFEFQNQVLIEL